jgi:hypothetical protein
LTYHSDNLNNTQIVNLIDDTSNVEAIKEIPTMNLINKTAPLDSTNNSSESVEILPTQAQGTIQVKLGARQQSLGILDDLVLYDTVYQALMKICNWEDGTCCKGMTLCQASFVIPGVAYNGFWGEVLIQLNIVNSGWQRSMGIRSLMMVRSQCQIYDASFNQRQSKF